MQVPQYIGGGGDLAQQILELMPFTNARDMLHRLVSQRDGELRDHAPPRLDPDADPRNGPQEPDEAA
jgi:hypothetical protein